MLPAYEDRRTFLCRKMDEFDIGPKSFNYKNIDKVATKIEAPDSTGSLSLTWFNWVFLTPLRAVLFSSWSYSRGC